MFQQDVRKMDDRSLTQPQPYPNLVHLLETGYMYIQCAFVPVWLGPLKRSELKGMAIIRTAAFTYCSRSCRERHATANDNVFQTDHRTRYPWQHHLGLASSHLCCAESTTQDANALGDHPSHDLADHIIHFNLRSDVFKRLHHVFMLSVPSWAFIGLYQVRSLVGGRGPTRSDARRYSIKMDVSCAITF